jgi:hypothetical protein
MEGRPDKRPGKFKEKANQAGATRSVDPNLMDGTLAEGYQRLADLDTAWERSVLAMFVVSEVHPFDDGNGRVARIMMNAELTAARQMRTVIPTVFREDYLGALRRLSRQDDATVLVKALRYANNWTARIDFSDLDGARNQTTATHAFELPEEGVQLLMPSTPQPETRGADLRGSVSRIRIWCVRRGAAVRVLWPTMGVRPPPIPRVVGGACATGPPCGRYQGRPGGKQAQRTRHADRP